MLNRASEVNVLVSHVKNLEAIGCLGVDEQADLTPTGPTASGESDVNKSM